VNRGHLSITEIWIAFGASYDAKDNDGVTPLHVAFEQKVNFYELLCSRSAHVNGRNNGNCTSWLRAYGIFKSEQVH